MQHESARQSGMRKCPDDFLCCKRSFLLIARTDRIVTAVPKRTTSTVGSSGVPAYSQICSRNYGGHHSYGRRLPGLHFGASLSEES